MFGSTPYHWYHSISKAFLIIPLWQHSFSTISSLKPRMYHGSRYKLSNLNIVFIILLTSISTKAAPSTHICNDSEPASPTISQHVERGLVINTAPRNFWDRHIQLILDREAKDEPIHSSLSTLAGKNTIQVTETTKGFPPTGLSSLKKRSKPNKKSIPSLVKRMPIDLATDKGKGSIIPKKLLRIPKLLAGLDSDSSPLIKMKSQLEESFKPSRWLNIVQRILRQITSKAIANGVVGSNWDCFTFQSNNSSDLDPSHLPSDIKLAFWEMIINDEDDNGSGIFRKIIMWAPIGTVLKRAEVDLHSNFPEILVAYVNTDSSAGIAKHTVNSFDPNRKNDNSKVQNQYLSYEFKIHRSTDRDDREEFKSDLVSESREDGHQNIFSQAFEFWISAILHNRLSSLTQIITIEPLIFDEESRLSFSASSINLSNGLEGEIKSIYFYSLPIFDPLISTRWKQEERPQPQ